MSEFQKRGEDKVNTFGIVIVAVVASVLVWVSIVALQVYYRNSDSELADRRASEGIDNELRSLKAAQTALLSKNEYADASKGLLKRLDIDLAMARVVESAGAGSASLVPRIGLHDTTDVPAQFGKQPDNPVAPAAEVAAEGEEVSAEQIAPAASATDPAPQPENATP